MVSLLHWTLLRHFNHRHGLLSSPKRKIIDIDTTTIEEVLKTRQDALKAQSELYRDGHGITTIDKAVRFFVEWAKTQKCKEGELKDQVVSMLLMCAILSHAIEPNGDKPISYANSLHGADIYFKAKEIMP